MLMSHFQADVLGALRGVRAGLTLAEIAKKSDHSEAMTKLTVEDLESLRYVHPSPDRTRFALTDDGQMLADALASVRRDVA